MFLLLEESSRGWLVLLPKETKTNLKQFSNTLRRGNKERDSKKRKDFQEHQRQQH